MILRPDLPERHIDTVIYTHIQETSLGFGGGRSIVSQDEGSVYIAPGIAVRLAQIRHPPNRNNLTPAVQIRVLGVLGVVGSGGCIRAFPTSAALGPPTRYRSIDYFVSRYGKYLGYTIIRCAGKNHRG